MDRPVKKENNQLPATRLTLDGSYILHQMFRIRWAAWRGASAQKHLLTRAATLFTAMEQNKQEATGLLSMLGHKGDLMLVHFRKSLDALNDAELTVAQSELYEYLDPSASCLSVVELGLYGASLKLYSELTAKGVAPRTGEWNREVEAELSKQRDAAAPRLWPEIPQRRYLCFYPMNKFRGETKNWYSQPIHERRIDRNQLTTYTVSSGGVVPDKRRVYAVPARLRLNQWALAGDGTVGKQPAVLNKANGRIAYRFHARDLHLVMGPAARGTSGRFRVLIDGKPPGVARGIDVDDQGYGTVTEQRLYQLIRQPKPIADRLFEIEFLDPGVGVFAFTFG
jgi:chlorite dismutase